MLFEEGMFEAAPPKKDESQPVQSQGKKGGKKNKKGTQIEMKAGFY